MRWFLFLMLACVTIGIFLNCSDPLSTGNPGKRVTVSGTVYGLWCPDGPNPGDARYSVAYGQLASLRVIDGSALTRTFQTDSLSTFSFEAIADTFTLVLETPHSRPDTFRNIAVANDTSLGIIVYLDYHEIESLILDFFYQPEADSAGMWKEQQYIRLLEGITGSELDIASADRSVSASEYGTWCSVTYVVPMSTRKPFWQIADALYIAFHDSSLIPVHMALENTFTICYSATSYLSPSTSLAEGRTPFLVTPSPFVSPRAPSCHPGPLRVTPGEDPGPSR